MAIPKIIHQTYKHANLPWLHQWHINQLKKKNPAYQYEFYDDERVDAEMKKILSAADYHLFQKIQIGAAKADFFRYVILYQTGGVYLDIDSLIVSPLKNLITPTDVAIISKESHLHSYCQYALFFDKNHPFLAKTIALVLDNLQNNRFPHNVHQMTGPAVFTKAVNLVLEENSNTPHKMLGIDYQGHVKFSFFMSKFFMYGFKKRLHWKKMEKTTTVLKA